MSIGPLEQSKLRCRRVFTSRACMTSLWIHNEEEMPPLPSINGLTCILHKCIKEKNLAHAMCLHTFMHPTGLDTHPCFENHLVLMWVDVESMAHAQQAFDRLLQPNESSWNALLTGHVQCRELRHAL
eukprot:c5116_g1_i1 orf=3-380(-)